MARLSVGAGICRGKQRVLRVGVAATLMFSLVTIVVASIGVPRAVAAPTTTTYSTTETIPVPPASNYAGSGGGDGWAVALSTSDVYNVFHHQATLQVACHLQSTAAPCWSPETITDANGNGFATSGQPGLWMDQATGHLYVFSTRTSDLTAGVVCVDTTVAATNIDPFCGFTALTAAGESPLYDNISFLSDPALVGTSWYAFNYVNGSGVTGGQNKLLCFDIATFAPCAAQPYVLGISTGTVTDTSFPPPSMSAFGGDVIVPVTVGSTDELACFDGTTAAPCTGSWPVPLGFSYDSNYGAPFPLLSSTAVLSGFCLPSPGDPCFGFAGTSIATPAGMANAITPNSG